MSQTRAELDRKLTLLESRVSEITPHNLAERYLPEYFFDQVIGGVLTAIGVTMAWSQYRSRQKRHRRQLHGELAAYHSWS
jgi:uncharacterized membrane protein YccC